MKTGAIWVHTSDYSLFELVLASSPRSDIMCLADSLEFRHGERSRIDSAGQCSNSIELKGWHDCRMKSR